MLWLKTADSMVEVAVFLQTRWERKIAFFTQKLNVTNFPGTQDTFIHYYCSIFSFKCKFFTEKQALFQKWWLSFKNAVSMAEMTVFMQTN